MDLLDQLERKEKRKELLADKLWTKITSKKLLVWSVSTYAMFTGKIDVNTWLIITSVFVGSEGAIDVASLLGKNGRK